MSFLDEGTFAGKGAVKDALKDPEFKALKGDEKANALKTLKMGGSVTTEIEEANAFLAAADVARDKGNKEFEFPKGSGKMHKVTLKRDLDLEEGKLSNALGGVAILASLLLLGKINSSDPVIQRLQAEYEQAEPTQQDSIKNLMSKRLLFLDTGKADASTPMDEGLGDKVGDALFGKSYDRPFSDLVDNIKSTLKKDDGTSKSNDNSLIKKIADIEKGNIPKNEFKSILGQLKKAGLNRKELKELEERYKAARKAKQDKEKKKPTNESNCGCGQTPCKTYGKMEETKEETNITGEYEGKPVKFNLKDITNLKDILNISNSAKDFVNKVAMAVTDETSSLSKEDTKKLISFYKKRTMKEAEDIKLPADTTFTLDLKHLIKKHMDEGKSKEEAITFTKKLMAKLHNKGEVTVDGTKVIFKEADVPQDTQLALPEPPEQTANFLGPDNMDYEGGMAKSQMLKMKNYAKALCDMIDDETQLESWVQAKLTKASDYMSAVYHYLDYQKSKMNELNEDEGQNIADFLNANYKEIASKLGNPGSNFEIIGDNKVATAGDGNEGIDISFDKNHMDKLFPKYDPYNEVKELTIAGKVVYYNDYRGSKMNELNEAKMSVNVNREDDEVEVTYKGERYKSALGDKLVFIHYFKDGEYHGENDAPKTFKYLKGKGGKLEVDDEEATLTINMSNLK